MLINGTGLSDYNDRLFVIKVSGSHERDSHGKYTIRVPYSRLGKTLERIRKMGAHVEDISQISGLTVAETTVSPQVNREQSQVKILDHATPETPPTSSASSSTPTLEQSSNQENLEFIDSSSFALTEDANQADQTVTEEHSSPSTSATQLPLEVAQKVEPKSTTVEHRPVVSVETTTSHSDSFIKPKKRAKGFHTSKKSIKSSKKKSWKSKKRK